MEIIMIGVVNYGPIKMYLVIIVRGGEFYYEFHSEDKRKHWFYGFINNEKNNFNIPLHIPMNQDNNKKL